MGRDKEAGNPAQLAKQKAEEAAAAAAAKGAEGPKRKLHKIKTGVVSSKGQCCALHASRESMARRRLR